MNRSNNNDLTDLILYYFIFVDCSVIIFSKSYFNQYSCNIQYTSIHTHLLQSIVIILFNYLCHLLLSVKTKRLAVMFNKKHIISHYNFFFVTFKTDLLWTNYDWCINLIAPHKVNSAQSRIWFLQEINTLLYIEFY